MSDLNKDERKGGLWAMLTGLFRGGSAASGGIAGLGTGGTGMGGLFATKAGAIGVLLGGATIAAGVGVVYNFIGPSSKAGYTPQLFQNTYYEEQSQNASAERFGQNSRSGIDVSTLDMFSEQAKKDGVSGLAAEAQGEGNGDSPVAGVAGGDMYTAGSEGGADVGAGAAAGYDSGTLSGGRLPSAGFKFSGGEGAGSRMAGGAASGALQSVSAAKKSAGASGKITPMKGAAAAVISGSSKRAVSKAGRDGAFGQAKYAGKVGAQAAYSADTAGAKTAATDAFSGETTGRGDVGGPSSGAGLGGAGVYSSPKPSLADPSLNTSQVTPPQVPTQPAESPWKKYVDLAMKGMMIAAGLVLATKLLGKMAMTFPVLYYAAAAAAAAAIFFAVKDVIMSGYKMMSTYGQSWQGGMYMAAGVALVLSAWNALCGLGDNPGITKTTTEMKMPSKVNVTGTENAFPKAPLSYKAPDPSVIKNLTTPTPVTTTTTTGMPPAWLKAMSGWGLDLGGML